MKVWLPFGYLEVGQLLEIIFTLVTVKVDPDAPAAPAPEDAEEPAPLLGLEAPALELPSDPDRRT